MADAHGSGPCVRKDVGVQLPPCAPRSNGPGLSGPFPGRTDASADQTDIESFSALEPNADGFRNYLGKGNRLPAEYLQVDRYDRI